MVNSVTELLGLVKSHSECLEAASRDLCVSIARIYIAALLLGRSNREKYDIIACYSDCKRVYFLQILC